MGTFSIWHILIVMVVVLVLFGAGKIPRLMKDLGSGVNAFKKGLRETDDEVETPDQKKQAASHMESKK